LLQKEEVDETTYLGFKQKVACEVCGREITREDYDNYQGMCWECWDSKIAEESEGMFDKNM